MRAVIHVEVANRKQAQDIEAGLAQPEVRAFALAIGVLSRLPSDRARERVLRYLWGYFNDPANYSLIDPATVAAAPRELATDARREQLLEE